MENTSKGHSRTKHIDIRYHFIRQHVQDGTIQLEYIPTDQMLADILTKSQPGPRFKENASQIVSSKEL